MAYEHKNKTYEVTVCGQVYYYALHSGRKNKIIFLSQVLNILEYVLFRKMKEGFRADNGILTQENFPFKVVRLRNRNPDEEPWERHDAVETALLLLAQEYYDSALSMLENPPLKKIEEAVEATAPAEEPKVEAPTTPRAPLQGEVWNP